MFSTANVKCQQIPNDGIHCLKRIDLLFQCDMAVGTKLFFDMMHKDPPKVMLFGGACTQVTAPLAESSRWWDIWQVSLSFHF